MAGFGWKLHGDGKSLAPGEVVRPDERLTWGRTVGLGAQHVVSMIGACFVAPILMGLDPNLAVMASGVATILFLLITRGHIPSWAAVCRSSVSPPSSRHRAVTRRLSPAHCWSSARSFSCAGRSSVRSGPASSMPYCLRWSRVRWSC